MVPLIFSGEKGAYVWFALFSRLSEKGVPHSEGGGTSQRNATWAFYETSAQCKYQAEYLLKAESLGSSTTDVQNFVLHLLANIFISPPSGEKSTYVLVGKNDERKYFAQ